MTPNDKVVLIVARQEDHVNNHLDNLDDPTYELTAAGKVMADLNALLREVKAEARAEQLRADDAEAEVEHLKAQLRKLQARRRLDYDPLDAQLVDACRDLEPRQIRHLFAYALAPGSGLTAIEHTQWLIERFRDACLAVSESVEAEEVA